VGLQTAAPAASAASAAVQEDSGAEGGDIIRGG